MLARSLHVKQVLACVVACAKLEACRQPVRVETGELSSAWRSVHRACCKAPHEAYSMLCAGMDTYCALKRLGWKLHPAIKDLPGWKGGPCLTPQLSIGMLCGALLASASPQVRQCCFSHCGFRIKRQTVFGWMRLCWIATPLRGRAPVPCNVVAAAWHAWCQHPAMHPAWGRGAG